MKTMEEGFNEELPDDEKKGYRSGAIAAVLKNKGENDEMCTQTSYSEAFPSSRVQLDIAKNEYEREKSRSNSLDNKAGIHIAAIVAIITVYIQILPFSDFVKAFEEASKVQACLLVVIIVGLAIGMIKIGFTFRSLSKAIDLKDFKRVCLINLTDINLLASPEDQTAEAMIRHFQDIVEHNEKTNSNKAKDLSKEMNAFIEWLADHGVESLAPIIAFISMCKL